MGCGNSKTAEIRKPCSSKYSYPECYYTYQSNQPITSITAIDSTHLLFGTKGKIVVYDLTAKSATLTFKEHKGRVNCLKKLKDNQFISAGQDKLIKLWDLNKTESLCTSVVWTLQELKDNKIASGADDKKLIIWDLNEKKQDCILDTEKSEISSLLYLQSGQLISGYGSGKVKIWDIDNNKIINEFNCDFGVWNMIELYNGKIALGIGNGEIQIWDINNLKCEHKLTGGHAAY